jgi:hypothetical protein
VREMARKGNVVEEAVLMIIICCCTFLKTLSPVIIISIKGTFLVNLKFKELIFEIYCIS